MPGDPKYWKPVAAAVTAGALLASSLTFAFAQTNQAPAPEDDTATTAANTAVEIDVLANDADPDGQGIHITEWTQGANGTVEVIDAIVHYTPNEDFTGDDTFEYTVSDGELETSATVTVTVEEASTENQAPEPVADTATTEVNTAVDIDVLANDADPDGDSISITEWTQPANGAVDVVDGIANYTPNTDFTGEDTFEYTVSDGDLTATTTVTVTVEEAAEAPVAVDDTATTAFDTAVEIDVLANDTAAEGATLTIESVTDPAGGTAEVVEGVVVYTPDAGFTGDDTFDYTITDGEATDTGTVTVTVGRDTSNLDPDVVAACESYTGDDATIQLLCQIYLDGRLSPFVQQIVGSIILLSIPVPPPDPVLEACEANAGDPTVDALCGVYQTEGIADWLKEGVGDLILRLTEEEVVEP